MADLSSLAFLNDAQSYAQLYYYSQAVNDILTKKPEALSKLRSVAPEIFDPVTTDFKRGVTTPQFLDAVYKARYEFGMTGITDRKQFDRISNYANQAAGDRAIAPTAEAVNELHARYMAHNANQVVDTQNDYKEKKKEEKATRKDVRKARRGVFGKVMLGVLGGTLALGLTGAFGLSIWGVVSTALTASFGITSGFAVGGVALGLIFGRLAIKGLGKMFSAISNAVKNARAKLKEAKKARKEKKRALKTAKTSMRAAQYTQSADNSYEATMRDLPWRAAGAMVALDAAPDSPMPGLLAELVDAAREAGDPSRGAGDPGLVAAADAAPRRDAGDPGRVVAADAAPRRDAGDPGRVDAADAAPRRDAVPPVAPREDEEEEEDALRRDPADTAVASVDVDYTFGSPTAGYTFDSITPATPAASAPTKTPKKGAEKKGAETKETPKKRRGRKTKATPESAPVVLTASEATIARDMFNKMWRDAVRTNIEDETKKDVSGPEIAGTFMDKIDSVPEKFVAEARKYANQHAQAIIDNPELVARERSWQQAVDKAQESETVRYPDWAMLGDEAFDRAVEEFRKTETAAAKDDAAKKAIEDFVKERQGQRLEAKLAEQLIAVEQEAARKEQEAKEKAEREAQEAARKEAEEKAQQARAAALDEIWQTALKKNGLLDSPSFTDEDFVKIAKEINKRAGMRKYKKAEITPEHIEAYLQVKKDENAEKIAAQNETVENKSGEIVSELGDEDGAREALDDGRIVVEAPAEEEPAEELAAPADIDVEKIYREAVEWRATYSATTNKNKALTGADLEQIERRFNRNIKALKEANPRKAREIDAQVAAINKDAILEEYNSKMPSLLSGETKEEKPVEPVAPTEDTPAPEETGKPVENPPSKKPKSKEEVDIEVQNALDANEEVADLKGRRDKLYAGVTKEEAVEYYNGMAQNERDEKAAKEKEMAAAKAELDDYFKIMKENGIEVGDDYVVVGDDKVLKEKGLAQRAGEITAKRNKYRALKDELREIDGRIEEYESAVKAIDEIDARLAQIEEETRAQIVAEDAAKEEPAPVEPVAPTETPKKEEPAAPTETPAEEEPAAKPAAKPAKKQKKEEPASEESAAPAETPAEEKPAAKPVAKPAEKPNKEEPAPEESLAAPKLGGLYATILDRKMAENRTRIPTARMLQEAENELRYICHQSPEILGLDSKETAKEEPAPAEPATPAKPGIRGKIGRLLSGAKAVAGKVIDGVSKPIRDRKERKREAEEAETARKAIDRTVDFFFEGAADGRAQFDGVLQDVQKHHYGKFSDEEIRKYMTERKDPKVQASVSEDKTERKAYETYEALAQRNIRTATREMIAGEKADLEGFTRIRERASELSNIHHVSTLALTDNRPDILEGEYMMLEKEWQKAVETVVGENGKRIDWTHLRLDTAYVKVVKCFLQKIDSTREELGELSYAKDHNLEWFLRERDQQVRDECQCYCDHAVRVFKDPEYDPTRKDEFEEMTESTLRKRRRESGDDSPDK